MDRDRVNLHQEVESMQIELKMAEERREGLEEEIRRRKNNEEETMAMLNSLRDQVFMQQNLLFASIVGPENLCSKSLCVF